MVKFPRIELQAAAFAAAALLAMPAAAQQTVDDHSTPAERPIMVYGAISQNADQGTPAERPIMVFGAIGQNEDHGSAQERPILIYGAIRDRNAAPQAEDPASRALPELPIVYEEAPARPTRR
ncbi:MAG: hypothetical protein QOH47_2178 [Sphingomonadales bacterium]|jgi:hypothetical protein|nr:hypothetical protein [Sphingomonadales bacterium]